MAHFTHAAEDEPGDAFVFRTVLGLVRDEEEFKSYDSDPKWELRAIYELVLIDGVELLPGSMEG